MFSVLQFVFLSNFINHMFHICSSSTSDCGSVVRALRFKRVRLPVQIESVCFCPSGASAPVIFKSSEAKPAPSSRHGGLPPRDNFLFAGQHFSANFSKSETIGMTVFLYLASSQQLTRDHFSWLCKWAMLQLQANRHLTFFSLNSGKAHRFQTDFG
jgi:hypothetical protein